MTFRALVYAYVIGGFTFIPLVLAGLVFFTFYTSVPLDDSDQCNQANVEVAGQGDEHPRDEKNETSDVDDPSLILDDLPKIRRGWLTMRRTFEESFDGSYVTLVRSFLDSRSKDPKRSRPKDTWYAILKGTVLYLYEDEGMTECEAALEISGHDVMIYPEGLPDGELFTRRNAICLKPKPGKEMPSVTQAMKMSTESLDQKADQPKGNGKKRGKEREKEREKLIEGEKRGSIAREDSFNLSIPWFIFVRSNVEMEDWYLSLVHASDYPAKSPTLAPLQAVFLPSDMNHLVSTLDSQPDVIPMRWLNAITGRLFFSYYRTQALEDEIIRRLMKKLSKVKRPAFLTDIVVTEVAVGDKTPTFSKPMLKELTKEGDTALEVHLQYKGEVRITIEATATINLGARFKTYVVKLTLAVVLREIEGNLLIKVKRPPSNRIWYAFTQTPRMVLDVEPIVSDRQITWSMILNTIEARLKEIIQESVVMPHMDDIAFFESSSYHHRGGIWSDASRHEKVSAVGQSMGAAASAPNLDVSKVIPSSEEEYPQLERSISAEVLHRSSASVPTPKSTPIDLSLPPSGTSKRIRPRSWFSGVTGHDEGGVTLASATEDSPNGDTKRGRTPEAEATAFWRSRSIPNRSRSPSGSSQDRDLEYTIEGGLLSPSIRRSSSHSSSLRDRFETSSISSSNSSGFATPNTARNPEALRLNSGSSHSSGSSSFLSTLKSRAGDKQAFSNSAKEAIRKLGVNWGASRKDGMSGGTVFDDMPDHDSVDLRRRVESNSSFSQRARASYAEVRAAVTEMRGKDKLGWRKDDGRLSPALTPETKERAANHVSSILPGGSPSFSGVSTSTVPSTPPFTRPPSDPSESSGALPKNITLTVSRDTEQGPNYRSEGQDLTIPNASNGPVSSSPIYTQPMQAKSMSIPGIHASHRGDVMSLGYVAPAPPSDHKVTNPVYRLWKSPSVSGEQQSGTESSPQPEEQSDPPDRNKDIVPLTLPPSMQSSPPTPTRPPPLPPRSTPTSVSRPVLDHVQHPFDSNDAVSSAASDALKSIATKDENKRASLERNLPTSLSRRESVDGIENSPESISPTSNDVTVLMDDDMKKTRPPPTSPTPTRSPAPPLPPRRMTPD